MVNNPLTHYMAIKRVVTTRTGDITKQCILESRCELVWPRQDIGRLRRMALAPFCLSVCKRRRVSLHNEPVIAAPRGCSCVLYSDILIQPHMCISSTITDGGPSYGTSLHIQRLPVAPQKVSFYHLQKM